MKPHVLAFSILAVTFSSCVVRVIEPEPIFTKPAPVTTTVVVVTPSPGVVIINQRVGLPAYPNSRVLKIDNKDGKDDKDKKDGGSGEVEFAPIFVRPYIAGLVNCGSLGVASRW